MRFLFHSNAGARRRGRFFRDEPAARSQRQNSRAAGKFLQIRRNLGRRLGQSPIFFQTVTGAALIVVALLLLHPSLVCAASTKVWRLSEYQDFLAGKFENVSLSREGAMTIAPKLEQIYSSDQPVIWDIAVAPDGSAYLGTGHQGHVYKVDQEGKTTLFWSAPEIEVFALAVASDGTVYAGTSPNGKVYRIDSSGNGEMVFDPKEKYIWSIAAPPGEKTLLYVGTGDQGKIYHIDVSGEGTLYADTKQRHVMSLAFDGEGCLLAGTDPNGIIYRIAEAGKIFALHDSDLPEIRSLQVAANGDIYAAVMGGRVPQITRAVSSAQASATTTVSVKVTEEGSEAPELGGQPQVPGQDTSQPVVTISQPDISYPSGETAALLWLKPDGAAQKLWTSNEENILALHLAEGDAARLTFATDRSGRVYQLDDDRRVRLLVETDQEQVTDLTPGPEGLLLASAHSGKLSRLAASPAEEGSYESPVHDAKVVARWGRLSCRGVHVAGGRVEFQTRSGNSARPDESWSEWSKPIQPTEEGVRGVRGEVSSPPGRYIQWRGTLRNEGEEAPLIRTVSLAYLPQNSPPVVKSIKVEAATTPADSGGANQGSTASSSDSSSAYSITVTASGESSTQNSGATEETAVGSGTKRTINISWEAEDRDGDKLTAEVAFRGEDESAWKLIKKDITENKTEIESETLADGMYRFQVRVSDRAANPPEAAQSAMRMSEPVLVDHTPPRVRVVSQDGRVSVEFEAVDGASMLQAAEYSIDAGPWIRVYAGDGITDSSRETFTVPLDGLEEGEHLVTLRVRDRAGNAGLAKAVIR